MTAMGHFLHKLINYTNKQTCVITGLAIPLRNLAVQYWAMFQMKGICFARRSVGSSDLKMHL